MRLIVHLGFHKTASTFLQHLFNDHSSDLIGHGVYYQREADYPAHRGGAWSLMKGDPVPFEMMLADAWAAGCHTVLLSAEDLESAICDPVAQRGIEEAAERAGITELEWHMVVREPGSYFASLFSQLQYHVYADALQLFYEVMRRGMAHIPDPFMGVETPYWYYVFDYDRLIGDFAARTPHRVVVHDYADRKPFPGWRIADRLGVLDVLARLPKEADRNRRLDGPAVVQGYMDRIEEVLPDPELRASLRAGMESNIRAGLASVDTYAAAVGDRYRDSWRAALARFAAEGEMAAE